MKSSTRATTKRPTTADRLETEFARSGERGFSGYVVNPAEPWRRFTVELLIDGTPTRIAVADSYVDELAAKGLGDGCYGFFFLVEPELLEHNTLVAARLANLETPVGSSIVIGNDSRKREPSGIGGSVHWLGGLRFRGWIAQAGTDQASVSVHVDGQLVTSAPAHEWTQIGGGLDDPRVVPAFDLHLPERFADGRVHRLTLIDQAGRTLPGSPIAFQAFAGGLADTIARLGGGLADARLLEDQLPTSMPMSRYREWSERFPNSAHPIAPSQVAIVMVGSGRVDDTLESLREQTHQGWTTACLPPTDEQAGFRPADLRSFIEGEGADAEIILCGLSGTLFAPKAIEQLCGAFEKFADARIAYGDLEIMANDRSRWPLFFPAFDYERLLEQGYCALLFGIRRVFLQRALAAGAANLYRLFNAVLDGDGPSSSAVIHAPGVVGTLPGLDILAASRALAAATRAHLRERGMDARIVPGAGTILPAIRVSRKVTEFETSIIIPARGRPGSLQKCLASIEPVIRKRAAEIIVIADASTALDEFNNTPAIAEVNARLIRDDGRGFSLARLCNLGAEMARSPHLCFLADRLEALDDQWLDEMLGRVQEPDAGAVGGVVLRETSLLEHAGIVLGPSFAAGPAFADRTDQDPGYGDLLRVSRQCSALSAEAMLTCRNDYLTVGGLDEVRFATRFGAVDFSLKLGALSKRIIFTPYARFRVSRPNDGVDSSRPMDDRRLKKDLRDLRAKWGEALAADPYYSPLLSLDPVPFSALAWPPRPTDPRTPRLPPCLTVPLGF